MLSNKPLMIGVIALLAVIRFIFVPWSEAQEVQQDAVSVITRQLQSALGAQQNLEPLANRLEQLKQQQQDIRSILVHGKSADELSLAMQKDWNAKAQQAKAEIDLFDWQSQILVTSPDIYQARIMLRVSGSIAAVANFITQLEQQAGVNVATLRVNVERSRSSLPAVNANLQIQLIFVMDAT